jgi:hypothetical protein
MCDPITLLSAAGSLFGKLANKPKAPPKIPAVAEPAALDTGAEVLVGGSSKKKKKKTTTASQQASADTTGSGLNTGAGATGVKIL